MTRCIIHIGWHKTGSTALQMAAHAARTELGAAGLHYPDLYHNHSEPVVCAVQKSPLPYFFETFVPPKPLHAGIPSAQSGQAFLDGAIAAVAGADLLLSGEDLCLLDQEEVDAVARQLCRAFETVEVVAYVRNHTDYLNSTIQQLVRMGFTIPELVETLRNNGGVDPRVRVMTLLPDYGSRLVRWINAFGTEAVHVHSYDQIIKDQDGVVSHFAKTHLQSAAQRTPLLAQRKPKNTSFSATAVHALSALHEETPLFERGAPNPAYRFNLQHFFKDMAGPPLRIAQQFEAELAAARAADKPALSDLLQASAYETMFAPRLAPTPAPHQDIDKGVLRAMSLMGTAALNDGARAKFFAALMTGKNHPQYPRARGTLHIARFLMTDPTMLANCAARLLRKRETALALAFIEKARDLGCDPARVQDLLGKVKEQQQQITEKSLRSSSILPIAQGPDIPSITSNKD
jgi:hypothetical protein